MLEDGTRRDHARSTLPELVAQLRASCEASACLQGGYSFHREQLAIFRDFAKKKKLFLSQSQPTLAQAPTEEGNEHQVWFEASTSTYLKATWPDCFGLKVIYRQDEEAAASPIDYLERWMLHNELFGDAVEFVGALDTSAGMRLIIRQPGISGEPATDEQINTFFISKGWKKFSLNSNIAYFDQNRQVVISDTHRGNIISLASGLLLPIDLRVQKLQGALLDIVIKKTKSRP